MESAKRPTPYEYAKTLPPPLRLFTYQFKGRDKEGKKIICAPSEWPDNQEVKEGTNGLALVLGKQRDDTYVYCLDFDTSYEEAGIIHLDAVNHGLEILLERTAHGGHVIFRTDGEINLCGKQVIYKRNAEGRAICEQLGAGQCVLIYPSPEKEKPVGYLTTVIPKDDAERLIQGVMERYGYNPEESLPSPAKPSGTPKAGVFSPSGKAKRGGEGTPLDYFNQNIDLVVETLERHGFQRMQDDETAYKYKRPGRRPDGDASIALYKEPTKGKNLVIQTFSHHMNTCDQTNCPSMFFQLEGLESVDSLSRLAFDNGYQVPALEVETVPTIRIPKTMQDDFNPFLPESWIIFDKTKESCKVVRTPADAIRYGIEHVNDRNVYQPSHLFPDNPIGRYFALRNRVTLNPQANGFALAMFASIASMTSRLFRSRHWGTWYDKPAFLSMFLARTASGKDDVLKSARCLWWSFANGFRKEYESAPRPGRWIDKKAKREDGEERTEEAFENFPLIQYLTLDKICSFAGTVEASGPAMAKNVLLKGSHAVLVDEIQDQFVKRDKGRNIVVDKASDLGKMLKEIYTHDETAYDGAECKDDSNNVRPVWNPALTLFGTGTLDETFLNYIDRDCIEGGLRARLCVWKGWAYTDTRTYNPAEAIRKNRELQRECSRMEENPDKRDAEEYARRLGRLYATILLLANKNPQHGQNGNLCFDVTRDCPPIMVNWEDDAVDDYGYYLAWIVEEKGLLDDDVAIMNRAQNKFSNLCLLYALSRLALSDDLIDKVRERNWELPVFVNDDASKLIGNSFRVTSEDVKNAFSFIVWDVIQLGVLRTQAYDARDEIRVKQQDDAWNQIFEASPYVRPNGERVITCRWLRNGCPKELLREAGLPRKSTAIVEELETKFKAYGLERDNKCLFKKEGGKAQTGTAYYMAK